MKLKTKKGQTAYSQLWQAAVGLGIFVIVGAMVALMISELDDTVSDDELATMTNETITFTSNLTGQETSHPRIASVSSVTNYTDVFPASEASVNSVEANYTANSTYVLLNNNETYVQGVYNVTYTYYEYGSAENVTSGGLDAVDLLADWQTIVVIAVIMIVLIGLILKEFGYIG